MSTDLIFLSVAYFSLLNYLLDFIQRRSRSSVFIALVYFKLILSDLISSTIILVAIFLACCHMYSSHYI
ncbi:hypothetical protein V1511DRAFT_504467 [Dipodascopsis uninucleata]